MGSLLINDQKSDLILFTGDLVNNKSSEASLVEKLSGLEAPYGKFSVLGNHDYGDYNQWEEAAKQENIIDVPKSTRIWALTYCLMRVSTLRKW